LRIAFITHEFPPDTGKGGIGTYTAQTATLLAKQGWDVQVFCGSPTRNITEQSAGYIVHRILCENGNDFKEKVVAVFSKQQHEKAFDVIESPEINSNALFLKKKFAKLPLVVRLHAPNYLVESLKKYYVPFRSKLRFFLGALRRGRWDLGYWKKYDFKNDPDYRFCQMADGITAPSQAMKDWVVQYWHMDAAKIKVIPNIYEPSAALLNIPINKETTNKQIVFFGRLNVLKGLVNATKVMAIILNKYKDWQFLVIGDDGPGPIPNSSMREWMQKELEQVKDRVSFNDGVAYELLPDKIAEAEIVLLPSLFESFSYTAAEAMAAGKAIIGSKNAGMADLIENNETGLLVNPLSVSEIKLALENLIADEANRFRLATNARAGTLQKSASKNTIDLLKNYYQKFLHN